MFNVFEQLFAPGRKHTDDEKKRLELSRIDVNDGDPGRGPIDLSSGKVLVRVPKQAAADSGDDSEAADPRDDSENDAAPEDGTGVQDVSAAAPDAPAAPAASDVPDVAAAQDVPEARQAPDA